MRRSTAGKLERDAQADRYYFADYLGSTALVTAGDGRPANDHGDAGRFDYDAYGTATSFGSRSPNVKRRYNGKELDETGLSYYGARYASTALGRWAGRDPANLFNAVAVGQNANLFVFDNNNPVTLVDPDGRQAVPPEYQWALVGHAVNETARRLGNAASDAGWKAGNAFVDYSRDKPVLSFAVGAGEAAARGRDASARGDSRAAAWETVHAVASVVAAFIEGFSLQGGKTNGMAGVEAEGSRIAGEVGPAGAKRGPKEWPTGSHNQTIERRIGELKNQGHEHLAGGPLTEEVIPTPGGEKSARRPDITTRAPDGSIHRENVGRTRVDGQPVKREVEALDDLQEATGTRPSFTPYDK